MFLYFSILSVLDRLLYMKTCYPLYHPRQMAGPGMNSSLYPRSRTLVERFAQYAYINVYINDKSLGHAGWDEILN